MRLIIIVIAMIYEVHKSSYSSTTDKEESLKIKEISKILLPHPSKNCSQYFFGELGKLLKSIKIFFTILLLVVILQKSNKNTNKKNIILSSFVFGVKNIQL